MKKRTLWKLLLLIMLLFCCSVVSAENRDKTILNQFSHSEYKLSEKSLHYVEHNPKIAEKIFLSKCTKCHKSDKALSMRAYKVWKNGITYMHDKSDKWLSDKDAKLIFLHMVIHLEPEIASAILQKENKSSKKVNWWIFFTYFSGILTILFMIITFSIAGIKSLRKKYFKKHRNFAKITLILSIIHGVYSFYIFVIR